MNYSVQGRRGRREEVEVVVVRAQAHKSGCLDSHHWHTVIVHFRVRAWEPPKLTGTLLPEEAFSHRDERYCKELGGTEIKTKKLSWSDNIDVTTLTQVHPLISLCFSLTNAKESFHQCRPRLSQLVVHCPCWAHLPSSTPSGVFWNAYYQTCYASGCCNCVAVETGTTGPRGVTGILITCVVTWLIHACLVLQIPPGILTSFIYTYRHIVKVLSLCLDVYKPDFFLYQSHNTIKYSDFCPAYPKFWWGWTESFQTGP